jgi:peroxiredoxin Q/BCP
LPPLQCGERGHFTGFGGRWNYPQRSGTRPDIEILGISVDEAFAQQTFAESLGLPFPLLSDTDATVTNLYGAAKLIPGGTDLAPVMLPGKGVQVTHDRIGASQAFFLIDKQGIVRGRWLPGDRTPMASDEILQMARSLAGKS